MNKKLSKLLLIISIIFIGLFTNTKRVKADDLCSYMVPLPYIDANGTAINFSISPIEYYQEQTGFNGWATTPATYVKSFHVYKTAESSDGITYQFGFKVDENNASEFELDSTTHAISTKSNFRVELSFSKYWTKKFDGCPDYIQMYRDGDNMEIKSATENEYKQYLDSGRMYNSEYRHSNTTIQFPATRISHSTTKIGNFTADSYVMYLAASNAVFINASKASKYDSKYWTRFTEEVGKYQGNANKQTMLDKMNLVLDTGSTDTRGHSKTYYDVTKNKIYNNVKSDMSGSVDNMSPVRKNEFIQWFSFAGRYIFEEDLDRFVEYFKFLYGDASDKTKVRATNIHNIDQLTYEALLETFDAMKDLKKTVDKQDSYEENKCNVYCKSCIKGDSSYNGTACTACTSSNNDYKTCNKCTTQRCKNVPGASYDSCLKGCMGDTLYSDYTQKTTEYEEEIEQDKKDATQKITFALTKIEVPTININFEKYEIQCEDVVIFHDIYLIIVIIAPIIAMTLGTVDYFRAVIAGDEKKMQEQKRKLPKRIIMLVCLILVPIIIDIVVSFSPSLNNSLVDCIVNGK